MDRLSSCYFCGAALDASLSEYPVVPRTLQPGDADDRTVVLCATCRRKLGAILEPVVDAAGGSPEATTVSADHDDADRIGLLGEAGVDPQPDPEAVGDADETVDDGGLLDSDDGDASGDANDDSAHPMSEHEQAGEDAAAGGTAGARDADAAGTAATEETAGAGEPVAGSSDDGGAAGTDPGPTGDGDDPSLTRLEYNKVMRLLQNRQLPVERDEIRDVATSAYDIAPGEFDAVVDAAVEQDLIAEEDGLLVDAE